MEAEELTPTLSLGPLEEEEELEASEAKSPMAQKVLVEDGVKGCTILEMEEVMPSDSVKDSDTAEKLEDVKTGTSDWERLRPLSD